LQIRTPYAISALQKCNLLPEAKAWMRKVKYRINKVLDKRIWEKILHQGLGGQSDYRKSGLCYEN